MKWYHIILYYLISSSAPLVAGDYQSIADQIKPNTITIIGETHKHPESITLFQSLISNHLKKNKCLTVGLEIASNQQSIIDKIKQGRAVVSDIEIPPMIDHPAFRKMIESLVKLQKTNECLKLIAIDAGDDVDLRRDEWMAIKLSEQVGKTPILVLLGNLHSLKRIDWDLSMTKDSPSVAEILSSQGYSIKSYPQIWTDKTCDDQNRFIKTDEAESLSLLNNHYISMLNAFEYKASEGVVDGILLWECKT
ncbi:MAG: hypothetical protein GQ532_13365 [Methylomarinum sp.]|nr:hypothetical protein [Methylomarinum sp.]